MHHRLEIDIESFSAAVQGALFHGMYITTVMFYTSFVTLHGQNYLRCMPCEYVFVLIQCVHLCIYCVKHFGA